ncbi:MULTISPECIES: 2,3,4,5-tetrahydropyridine-2,6-dicarboxylate N-succinyltransferase [unclassified Brevundimonas]|jgi:2,3,4,5-tetrahydropyridine-2-carboxylate N-succinyltransferase|uniref:2,3,4,5-tetrahydropyridine-2,6-dicarboxylate N-succinyltransferase n=1 Tax=unclassified Brevundimonas TaxID=2622653 RepID=UPI000C5F7C9B|nr:MULTISPECIES: 2,3,4,5-tetrahydropyridine-2,6-dicarboxylate N-succinyltransferase [unclassified Brevundimonas]MAL88670.1 2,3,4,5-tetrahydropyridine-2,6-dicarboxylate N-succinyltransferase [Brevundimonas sp.]|tara:strand:- start:2594 stop:3454 length:861 start_codon:yes stop_codon:yes gene_type:complete
MSDPAHFKSVIEQAWEDRASVSTATTGEIRDAVDYALAGLDDGSLRVASREADGAWTTHQWLKKAVLLSFRLNPNVRMGLATNAGAGTPDSAPGPYWDKVPVKWAGWTDARFEAAGFRAVPGAVARHGSFIGRDVVLMPSFVNIGARVEEGTMVDTWATVGSCAQIGKNVHLSGGAGIGGVLEPLQANPTIIEDGCFIGARAEVAEGVIVREGAVLAMGVYLSASTKIVDRATGEVFRGEVPAFSVVVPGTLPDPNGGPGLYCAVIVKRVDAQTRAKTGVNELLRA